MKLQFDEVFATPWQRLDAPPRPRDKAIRQYLHKQFADWQIKPRDDKDPEIARFHAATVDADDAQLAPRLAALKKFVEDAGDLHLVLQATLTEAEAKRARCLPVTPLEDVSENEKVGHLNTWPKLRCKACGDPDVSVMPPVVVIDKLVRKASKVNQQVFAGDGWIVVRPKLREVIESAIGDQVEIGECVVHGEAARKVKDDPRLYWVRPREVFDLRNGWLDDPDWKAEKCPACGDTFPAVRRRPEAERAKDIPHWMRPGLLDRRRRFPRMPTGDIAVGQRRQRNEDGQIYYFRDFYMSGALAFFLKSQGASGLLVKESGTDGFNCVWPADDSLPLVDKPREFSKPGKPGKAVPAPKGRKGKAAATADAATDAAADGKAIVERFADVPWDHTSDSYVYVHLTTPNLVMLDPMSMDEPGTFRVPKFKPGLWRFPVGAIRRARSGRKEVSVDSASLAFVDAPFFPDWQDNFDWYSMPSKQGAALARYCARVAKAVGHRFGYCTAPGIDSGYEFEGDGGYTLEVNRLEFVRA